MMSDDIGEPLEFVTFFKFLHGTRIVRAIWWLCSKLRICVIISDRIPQAVDKEKKTFP